MPLSLWLKWKAYQRIEGPLSEAARADYHAAMIAMYTAMPNIREEDREIRKFLPPWRRASDYAQWVDLGEEEHGPAEYEIE
jgi:hypothetical protein